MFQEKNKIKEYKKKRNKMKWWVNKKNIYSAITWKKTGLKFATYFVQPIKSAFRLDVEQKL